MYFLSANPIIEEIVENEEILHFLVAMVNDGDKKGGRLVEVELTAPTDPRYIWNAGAPKSKKKPKVLRESNARRVVVVYPPPGEEWSSEPK